MSDPGAVLAPLADRHVTWLQMDVDEVTADRGSRAAELSAGDDAAQDVRAMQLVLRMERTDPPRWSDALAASCIAATAICLDPRSEPGGEWHDAVADYLGVHIRKVTRRARAGHWTAAAELPGITVLTGSAEVRALVPGPVAELDKRISRLQVGGTDVPVDLEPVGDTVATPGVLVLAVPEHIVMTTGKLMAQTGHAGMITAALLARHAPSALTRWHDAGLPVVVRLLPRDVWATLLASADDEDWGHRLVPVRDAGFTEIAPGTVTVIGIAGGLD